MKMFEFTQLSYELFGGAEESTKVKKIIALKTEIESTQKDILLEDIRSFVHSIYLDKIRENNKFLEEQIKTQKQGNQSYQKIVQKFNELQTSMVNIFPLSLKIVVRHQNSFFDDFYHSNFQAKFEHEYSEMENDFKETEHFYKNINIVKETKELLTAIDLKKSEYERKKKEIYDGSKSLEFILKETKNQMNKTIVNAVKSFKIEKALYDLKTELEKKENSCMAKEKEILDFKNKTIFLDDDEDISFLNKLTLFDIDEFKNFFVEKESKVNLNNLGQNIEKITNLNINTPNEIKYSFSKKMEVNLNKSEKKVSPNKSEVGKLNENEIRNSFYKENEKQCETLISTSLKGSHKIMKTSKLNGKKVMQQKSRKKIIKKMFTNEAIEKNIKQLMLETVQTKLKNESEKNMNIEREHELSNENHINRIKNEHQEKNSNFRFQIKLNSDNSNEESSNVKNNSKEKASVVDSCFLKRNNPVKLTKRSLDKENSVEKLTEIQNENKNLDSVVENFVVEERPALQSKLLILNKNETNQHESLQKAASEINTSEKNLELGSQSVTYSTNIKSSILITPSVINFKDNLKRNVEVTSYNNLSHPNKKLKNNVNSPLSNSLPTDIKFKSPKNVADLNKTESRNNEKNQLLQNTNMAKTPISTSGISERKLENEKIKISDLESLQMLKNNFNFDLSDLTNLANDLDAKSNKSVQSLKNIFNLSFNFDDEDKENMMTERSMINCEFFDSEQKSKAGSNGSVGNGSLNFNFDNKDSPNSNGQFNFEGFLL